MRHAVILAGGSGTRLWPASRQALPKQLLPLLPGGKSLLAATIERARTVVGDNVMIVTAAAQADATRAVAGDVEILVEPVGRNTAPAVGLAAASLIRRDADAVMAILPADQWIERDDLLKRAFDVGLDAVEHGDVIGTIGITPTHPETGFGYLEVDAAAPYTLCEVRRFVEKPKREAAEHYVASGTYLWNAGIFFASAKRLLRELDVHVPPIGRAVQEIAAGTTAIDVAYPTLQSISIDYAVMERATRVMTVPANELGWSDVGSWAALPAVLGEIDGNTIRGDAFVDGQRNIVYSDGFVAVVGLDDVVVVKSGDAVLVMKKDSAQDVRKVVEALSARGLQRYL